MPFIDGVDIRRIPLASLEEIDRVCAPGYFLFSDTIRGNIAFGSLDATDEEIEQAAKLAQIYDEIMEFPEGMKTNGWRKGDHPLRGPEAKDRHCQGDFNQPSASSSWTTPSHPWTSDGGKDSQGWRGPSGEDKPCCHHRVAPFRRGDRIVSLDEGKIVETGDHFSLLSRGGVYADLCRRSRLEEELEEEGLNRYPPP